MGSGEEIEEWYSEARRLLDERFQAALQKDIADEKSKRRYQQNLTKLQRRYERLHQRLDRRLETRRLMHKSAPFRAWRWLRSFPRRALAALKKEDI